MGFTKGKGRGRRSDNLKLCKCQRPLASHSKKIDSNNFKGGVQFRLKQDATKLIQSADDLSAAYCCITQGVCPRKCILGPLLTSPQFYQKLKQKQSQAILSHECYVSSFEHRQSYRNVMHHFEIGIQKSTQWCKPNNCIQLCIAPIVRNVFYKEIVLPLFQIQLY